MYAWGGDTSKWAGSKKYDFDSARKPYLDSLADDAGKGPRTYTAPAGPDNALVNAYGKLITSESTDPIIIGVDVTGSMSSWPAAIFDRLPLLYQTLSQYRPNAEFCFAAIGDATCDSFPLQVNNFGKGLELEKHVKALFPEGKGGGHITESYELFGYFMLEHCKTPKATSPFLLIYGDETFYDEVNPRQVKKYIGDTLERTLPSKEVWKRLMQRFNVYHLHKPYGNSSDDEILRYWADAIGPQRIIKVPSEDRAVDIGMGIIAKYWGEFDDFKSNLDARHDSKKVKDSVYHSLRYIPDDKSPSSKLLVSHHSNPVKSALTKMKD